MCWEAALIRYSGWIWPLIVLLATTVFGLLYRVIITAPG